MHRFHPAGPPHVKLLVMTHSYGLNGAAWILKRAMQHWVGLGWRVDALLNEQSETAHGGELRALGIRTPKSADIPTDYDLALVNTMIDIGLAERIAGKLPTALWIHEGATVIRGWKHTPVELMRQLALPDLLIFDSAWQVDSVFRSFVHELPPERVTCVPCGVEAPPRPARLESGDTVNIVCVGSVYGRKRPLDLARAAVRLSQHRAVRCSFVGDLTHAAALVPRFDEFRLHPSGILQWLGGVSDDVKFAVIADSDIACFPSEDETFGLSALEAALAGLPVVLADLPVYRSVGWVDGVNCLTYPVANVGLLEERLTALAGDGALRRRIADGAATLAQRYRMAPFLDRITATVSSIARRR